ncbi:MAG: hypothetical protein IJW79_10565 [Clostridia bacterium]|nr:hypothetical protein [Clostridia bacterium]
MINFGLLDKQDYDKEIKIGKQNLRCYSPKMMKTLYPNGGYGVLGEVTTASPKPEEELSEKKREKLEAQRNGYINIGEEKFDTLSSGSKSKYTHRNGGYICVGEDKFIVVKVSLLPLFIAIGSALAVIVAVLILILSMNNRKKIGETYETEYPSIGGTETEPPETEYPDIGGTETEPPETDYPHLGGYETDKPDRPDIGGGDETDPPETDRPDIGGGDETDPPETDKPDIGGGDETDPPETDKPTPEGGGSVSLTYTLTAKVDTGSRSISMYFGNPQQSSHDAMLELYVIEDGTRYFISRSEKIKVGGTIKDMPLDETAAGLPAGIYSGVYVVSFYHPTTGEKATVTPEITGVNIYVYN